ncbi:GerAB/ArcD/ProY family transporter [Paenibacillus pectinilyticus]|nr:endospore germination permease [Paenibacillus pectinilyticus]
MNVKKQITALQLYYVIIISIAITNHVLLIPVLLHYGKRDSWVGASIALLPLMLFTLLVYYLIRRTKQGNLMDWVDQRLGKWGTYPLKIVVVLVTLLHASITLRDVTSWAHITYLPKTPGYMISLAFMLFCFFAAREGIKAIAITAGILLPGVVMLGYFVMGANFQYKDYQLLTPLFTHGYGPTFISMILTCGASFEMLSILFLQQHVKTRIRLWSLLILTTCVIGLTIGPLTGTIAIFGPFESANLRYPAFEQWRMVNLGKYISHLDFLSIFQWISGACMRTSILMFMLVDNLGIQKKSTKTQTLIWVSLLLFGSSLYPVSDHFFVNWLQKYYYSTMFVFGICMLLVLLVLSVLPVRRKEKDA